MNGEGIGFGKAILFNEHFVVYGVPAIVSAIGKYTLVKASDFDQPTIDLNAQRNATPGYKNDKIVEEVFNHVDAIPLNWVEAYMLQVALVQVPHLVMRSPGLFHSFTS